MKTREWFLPILFISCSRIFTTTILDVENKDMDTLKEIKSEIGKHSAVIILFRMSFLFAGNSHVRPTYKNVLFFGYFRCNSLALLDIYLISEDSRLIWYCTNSLACQPCRIMKAVVSLGSCFLHLPSQWAMSIQGQPLYHYTLVLFDVGYPFFPPFWQLCNLL